MGPSHNIRSVRPRTFHNRRHRRPQRSLAVLRARCLAHQLVVPRAVTVDASRAETASETANVSG